MNFLKKSLNILLGLLISPFAFLVACWQVSRKRDYLIHGTFSLKNGGRRFFRSSFATYGNFVPIHDLEAVLRRIHAQEYEIDRLIILGFQRISAKTAKYIDQKWDDEIGVNSDLLEDEAE